MKIRLPICFSSAVLSALTYVIFAAVAYAKNPQPISPLRNWLSDLGNQITNPQGAIFYNLGIITCAVFLAIWFVAGLSQWRLKDHLVQQRLLFVSRAGGVLTAFALLMSALYPINRLEAHAFWSDANFILFGVSFAFSVAALRYHPLIPRALLYFGGVAAILPSIFLALNNVYWLEWVSISIFIVYILSIGILSYIISQQTPNPGRLSI